MTLIANAIDHITVEKLSAMLERQEPVTLLDIRPREQREEWHIPGSIHSDVYDAVKSGDPDALSSLELPDGIPVVTICAAGQTSIIAAEQLRGRGIDAISLESGMRAWSLAWNLAEIPLPVSMTEVVQVRRTGKGCLSYLIGSQGEAAVIDPSLDPSVYQRIAAQYGWVITHVLETHVHADHLMRSRELARRTRAQLHLPATRRAEFSFSPLNDLDIIDIGMATVQVMHTPGHTLESSSFLLDGEALLTGDTLFLAGVGRPDLDASPAEAIQQAHLLWHSLQRIGALPPEIIILPGHSNRPIPFDHTPAAATLAQVRETVALLAAKEDEFVRLIMARIPLTPPNHHQIVEINESGVPFAGDPVDLEAGANRCAIS